MADFSELLKSYREASKLSQRALARLSRVNPAIISRMEAGDRGPSGPEQVLALASALGVDQDAADALLSAAGFWPRAVLRLGPQDDTLLAVSRLLTRPEVSARSKTRFRQIVALLVAELEGS